MPVVNIIFIAFLSLGRVPDISDLQVSIYLEPAIASASHAVHFELSITYGQSPYGVGDWDEKHFGTEPLQNIQIAIGERTVTNYRYKFEETSSLSWPLPKAEDASQVKISFDQPNRLIGTENRNNLRYEWLGPWGQIEKGVFKVIFPTGYNVKDYRVKKPLNRSGNVESHYQTVYVFFNEHSALKPLEFEMLFKPGIVQYFGAYRLNLRDMYVFLVTLIMFVVVFVLLIRWIRTKAFSRGRRKTEHSTDLMGFYTTHLQKMEGKDDEKSDKEEIKLK